MPQIRKLSKRVVSLLFKEYWPGNTVLRQQQLKHFSKTK